VTKPWALAGVLGLLVAGPARADIAPAQDPSCTQSAALDEYQLLRRLSLDLRGKPPTVDEYARLDDNHTHALDVADAWIGTFDPEQAAPTPDQEAYRQQMRRYHQALLWPNISNVRITSVSTQFRVGPKEPDGGDGVFYLPSTGRAQWQYQPSFNHDWTYATDLSTFQTYAPCLDREQPDEQHGGYYPGGGFRPKPQAGGPSDPPQWVGYRVIQPYWSPDAGTVKVCAYDAQENTEAISYAWTPSDGGPKSGIDWPGHTTPDGGGNRADCDSAAGANHTWCGCGPHLDWCFGPNQPTEILNDMTEQMMKLIDLSTVGGRPYTDLVTSKTSYVNGRLSHYKQFLGDMNDTIGTTYTENDPDEVAVNDTGALTQPGAYPRLDYVKDSAHWTRVMRASEHAGVLTLPGYLLRFQTNRSRANRFRIDFLCNYFVPPDQLNDAPPACSPDTNDLMQKCNCRFCHATLEPLAAHWAGFSEAGFSLLKTDADGTSYPDGGGFPDYDKTCTPLVTPTDGGPPQEYPDGGFKTNQSARCKRYYVTNPGYDTSADQSADGVAHRYDGRLKTHLYDDVHEALRNSILNGIDDGDHSLSHDVIAASDDFAQCTVKKLFTYLNRREMRISGADNDEAVLLTTLTASFKKDYDFTKLVKAIISQPQYRRIR
jgi:hypothetical protein